MTSHDLFEQLRTLAPPRRNNYFYGKRLDVPQFRMEQDYGKLKQWLLNRLSLGEGVLCGLDVTSKDGKICVSPGVAIDGLGREIIVPLQSCIDPWALPETCCGDAPQPTPTPAPGDRNATRAVTLWLCYRECLTDMMPTLVSDCEVRQECAPGTIVETFSLKVTDGLPPELDDPTWCEALHPTPTPSPAPTGTPTPTPTPTGTPTPTPTPVPTATPTPTPGPIFLAGTPSPTTSPAPTGTPAPGLVTWPTNYQKSSREIVCELLDDSCCPPKGDPCVPLAAVLLQDGQIAQIETCHYRPRVYSNAMLFDLILCLMQRIEECCGQQAQPTPTPSPTPSPTPTPTATPTPTPTPTSTPTPTPSPTPSPTPTPTPPPTPTPTPPPQDTLRVRAVTVLSASGAALQKLTTAGGSIQVPRTESPSIIRVNFTGKLEPKSVTAGIPNAGDDPNKFTFLVLGRGQYPQNVTPGKIAGATNSEAQFRYQDGPFPAGRYQVTLMGSPDATVGRPTILSTDGAQLDGEPTQFPSGDGTPGGNFVFTLIIT